MASYMYAGAGTCTNRITLRLLFIIVTCLLASILPAQEQGKNQQLQAGDNRQLFLRPGVVDTNPRAMAPVITILQEPGFLKPGVSQPAPVVRAAVVAIREQLFRKPVTTGAPASGGARVNPAKQSQQEITPLAVLPQQFYCTYSQGYYGNTKGSSCDGSRSYANTTSLLDVLLGINPGPSKPLTVGRGGYSVVVPGTVAGRNKLLQYLPGGGKPEALVAGDCAITASCFSTYLKKNTIDNSLLAQTITLTLNSRLNNGNLLSLPLQKGYLVTQKRAGCGTTAGYVSCTSDPGAIKAVWMVNEVVDYLTNNGTQPATIADLLNLANDVLGRLLTPGDPGAWGKLVPSFDLITKQVDIINNAFEGCRGFIKYYETLCQVDCVNYSKEPPCSITDIRLGGEPADQYIGITCNEDGTYRTCFYISGNDLPAETSAYKIWIDGVAYPVALAVPLSASEVVVCVTGLPTGNTGVDVFIELGPYAVGEVKDLYDAPETCLAITGIRVAGPGDQYIGPTCNNDDTYRSCFYVTGINLPQSASHYKMFLDGTEYPVAFFQAISNTEVVLCATGLPQSKTGVDVKVVLSYGPMLEIPDLYDAPTCQSLTGIRTGGQAGDQYVGLSCNNDDTYRTCFYITGLNLPNTISGYKIFLDGVEYTPAFFQLINAGTAVVCLTGLPQSQMGVDVKVVLSNGLTLEVPNLYDAPTCQSLTGIRIGGQAGDQYIGPTCNNDNSYRTCFYITGSNLPTTIASYRLFLDGIEYTPAFFQLINSGETVICLSSLPQSQMDVDVKVVLNNGLMLEVPNLYDAPTCQSLTGIRIGGQAGDQYIGPTCDQGNTYRTCFYISGLNLPSTIASYKLFLDGVEYTPAFLQVLSTSQVVLCVIGLPQSQIGVDVKLVLSNGLILEIPDLYDAPTCQSLTGIRVAGQAGDQYIGPTCNNDNTYRTCFYITGANLPGTISGYKIFLDGVEYVPAFFQATSTSQSVICLTGLPPGQSGVDVKVVLSNGLMLEIPDLYNAPNCGTAPITDRGIPQQQEVSLFNNLNRLPTIKAYPNPFTDRLQFVIQSPVAGQATIELFTINGQKVHTVYQGMIRANTEYQIPYKPGINTGVIIYRLTVDDKQVSGKLIPLR